jgi:shikimate kinase
MIPERVDLIGYRGAGKSTVGSILARHLCWDFIDSDLEIEKQSGCTVVEMFKKNVPEFRRLESELMQRLRHRRQIVVAWGGGVVLAESNRSLLRQSFCVWLTAEPNELFRRTQADPQTTHLRPALTSLSSRDEVAHVLTERQPLYAEAATLTIATEGREPSEVAAKILEEMYR